ncbi:hypothetical protein [Pseudoxanthomonas sp. UTMC 1351]|uniref:spike base protein, RCAP_Rcc01079 family n=1 Tax=Pseudoxanthomonas sp. UTMC 1351 TaxID=2695853 RepID=UPI0034CFCB18
MPAENPYSNYAPSPFGPARIQFNFDPSDTVDLQYVTTGIYIGGSGDLRFISAGTGLPAVQRNVVAGAYYPICVTRVRTTGTTATDLLGYA